MTWTAEIGFGLAVLPLVLTPGASFTLATHAAVARRRSGVGATIAGTATGICCHALLASLGLAAVVMRSSEAFAVVKAVGGAYLVALGAWTLWASRRAGVRGASDAGDAGDAAGTHERRRGYPRALGANVLNPKAASVYLTLAPQFLASGRSPVAGMLALAAVHVVLMAAWLALWSALVRRGVRLASAAEARRALVRWVTRAGGAVLVVLGVRAAATA